MNYSDEPYVRLYTRDTVTWKLMSFEARTVLLLMLKRGFDRSGSLDLEGYEPAKVVAAMARMPIEVAGPGLRELLRIGTWVLENGYLSWPGYEHAQSCKNSGRQREPGTCRRPISGDLRDEIIKRDMRVCGICHGIVERSDIHIDHIQPVSKGGTNDPDNLQVTHSKCNLAKGAKVQ